MFLFLEDKLLVKTTRRNWRLCFIAQTIHAQIAGRFSRPLAKTNYMIVRMTGYIHILHYFHRETSNLFGTNSIHYRNIIIILNISFQHFRPLSSSVLAVGCQTGIMIWTINQHSSAIR